eukprot:CAMPEP_0175384258 /NCGR_PEP_ID=MMETSP0095-20121207/28248_1 /TAXON_ID=311494 /ORGANISM="Alexandrium monilatum, Strain CCMP3105" /LENGTH=344 /DNA_ID=CAMNT_0016682667 /DNA_START=6 /DNA_END=1037 /DNA_ORIENTATION=-
MMQAASIQAAMQHAAAGMPQGLGAQAAMQHVAALGAHGSLAAPNAGMPLAPNPASVGGACTAGPCSAAAMQASLRPTPPMGQAKGNSGPNVGIPPGTAVGGSGGPGADDTVSDNHTELVKRVKRLQRDDEVQRQLWWQWCDATGHGVRDPKRHTEQFMLEFFDAVARDEVPNVLLKASARSGASSSTAGGGGGAMSRDFQALAAVSEDAGLDELVNRVKEGQRQSTEWKRRWWRHCDQNGNGIRDPRRHEIAFLLEFLQLVTSEELPQEEPSAVFRPGAAAGEAAEAAADAAAVAVAGAAAAPGRRQHGLPTAALPPQPTRRLTRKHRSRAESEAGTWRGAQSG